MRIEPTTTYMSYELTIVPRVRQTFGRVNSRVFHVNSNADLIPQLPDDSGCLESYLSRHFLPTLPTTSSSIVTHGESQKCHHRLELHPVTPCNITKLSNGAFVSSRKPTGIMLWIKHPRGREPLTTRTFLRLFCSLC